MFQDINVSKDLNMGFLEFLKVKHPATGQQQSMTNLIDLDFNIYVLQVTKSFSIEYRSKIVGLDLGKFMAGSSTNSQYIHSTSTTGEAFTNGMSSLRGWTAARGIDSVSGPSH